MTGMTNRAELVLILRCGSAGCGEQITVAAHVEDFAHVASEAAKLPPEIAHTWSCVEDTPGRHTWLCPRCVAARRVWRTRLGDNLAMPRTDASDAPGAHDAHDAHEQTE